MRALANTMGDGLALAAGSLALAFVARMRRTYFLDSRFFIGVANVAFNLILVDYLFSDVENVPPSQLIFTSMIAISAASIGFASYMLKVGKGESGLPELRSFLSAPPAQFLIFVSSVAAWALCGIELQPWSLDTALASQGIFHFSYQPWYLILSGIIAVLFISLPVLGVYRQSFDLSDYKASRAIKTISFCWAGFGIASFFQAALVQAQTVGVIADGLLFVGIAFALREPTVLSRVISALPPPEKSAALPTIPDKAVDRIGQQDSFASLLGTRHGELIGFSFLVEFEPSSSFESIVREFVEEFQLNTEPVAVFTSVGSPVHKQMRRLLGVRLFAFSTKTSTPTKGVGEEVLLPERDASLLLDAIDKLLETTRGKNVGVVLDVFTDLFLLQGFDKAYGVLSSVMEMLDSGAVATLVMVNLAAHDEKVLNGIRGLFRSRVVFDSNGIRLVRFNPHVERNLGRESLESLESRVGGLHGD